MQALHKGGEVVVVIGDDTNDAPALHINYVCIFLLSKHNNDLFA